MQLVGSGRSDQEQILQDMQSDSWELPTRWSDLQALVYILLLYFHSQEDPAQMLGA